MSVWKLIVKAFETVVKRDSILSERIARLEEETGLEIELQELMGRMQGQVVLPASTNLLK
jgi:hypothetical protein